MLGPGVPLFGWGDCGFPETGTLSDSLTAVARTPFGRGSGTVVINQTLRGQTITCGPSMLAFCGDNVWNLSFDPASKNIFFGDQDTGEMSVGHIDFGALQLLPTATVIPTAELFFSPDSRLVYVVNGDIGVYAFDADTGDTGASSLLPRPAFTSSLMFETF